MHLAHSSDGFLEYPFHTTFSTCKDEYSLIKLHLPVGMGLSQNAVPPEPKNMLRSYYPRSHAATPPTAAVETRCLIATEVGQGPECGLGSWLLCATAGRGAAGGGRRRNRIVYVVSGVLGGFVRVKLWSLLSA